MHALAADTYSMERCRTNQPVPCSYPNLIPLCATAVEGIKNRLEPLDFDRLYAGWWGRAVKSDAHDVVMRSADRYIGILRETVKVEYF